MHVEELYACCLESLHHDLSNALHEFVAKIMVLFAFGTQARTIQGNCPYRLNDPCVEMPAVRREKPRTTPHPTRLPRLLNKRTPPLNNKLKHHHALGRHR